MTRPLRHNQAGWVYHCYNRAANGQLMYTDDIDRRVFVRIMVRVLSRQDVEMLSFCLMGNHLHLLVRCLAPCLDAFMRDLMSAYVRYFNERHGVEGRLCRDRYESKPVDSPRYLHTLGLYIHRNPKDLGYDGRLIEYPWSSLAFLTAPEEAPWWLNPAPVLDVIGGPDVLARTVEGPGPFAVGTDAGPEEIYAHWAVRHIEDVLVSLDVCADSTADQISRRDRRAIALVLARESTDVSFEVLADALGYSGRASVHRAVENARGRIAEDPAVAHGLDEARRTLHRSD